MASVWGGDSPLVAWGQNAWESNTITASLTAPTPITASLGTISHEMAYDLTGISSTASLGSLSFLAYTDIGISGNTAYSDVDVTGNTSYTDINHVA